MELQRTKPCPSKDSPARKAIIQNVLCFFSIYQSQLRYWDNERLLAHTHPSYRHQLTEALIDEEEKEYMLERAVFVRTNTLLS